MVVFLYHISLPYLAAILAIIFHPAPVKCVLRPSYYWGLSYYFGLSYFFGLSYYRSYRTMCDVALRCTAPMSRRAALHRICSSTGVAPHRIRTDDAPHGTRLALPMSARPIIAPIVRHVPCCLSTCTIQSARLIFVEGTYRVLELWGKGLRS
jgi:hypothetical protein